MTLTQENSILAQIDFEKTAARIDDITAELKRDNDMADHIKQLRVEVVHWAAKVDKLNRQLDANKGKSVPRLQHDYHMALAYFCAARSELMAMGGYE